MNNGIGKTNIIEQEKLNSEFYFQSLLEQAQSKGLLSQGDIERIQRECISLLAQKTEKYNAGDSSSIRLEKAQDIMTSNLFTIGLFLKKYKNPDDAVDVIKTEKISEIYKKGRRRIDTLIEISKTLHAKLLDQLVDTPNVFYRSTLVDGIKGFFKLYYPDYAAHEIHITADYPLFSQISHLRGIEFIKAYVEAAYYENLFCSYFPPQNIHHLLCGYIYDYTEHLINIYEPTLLTALACIIAQRDVYSLDISKNGAEYIHCLFSSASQTEQSSLILTAFNTLNEEMSFPSGLHRYINNSLPSIISRITSTPKDQLLCQLFVTPSYTESIKTVIHFGKKMDNKKYRKILEEIIQCRFSSDKMVIIKEHIHSLSDLTDVLLDADLTKEEIYLVLRELSLHEIAAFSKKYISENEIFDIRQQEQFFINCLRDFISELPQEQRESVSEMQIVIEE